MKPDGQDGIVRAGLNHLRVDSGGVNSLVRKLEIRLQNAADISEADARRADVVLCNVELAEVT